MIVNLRDVLVVAVGDDGYTTPPPSRPAAPVRKGVPPQGWACVPTPPSPKRAKPTNYLGALLYQIAGEVGRSDYVRDQPNTIAYRKQNVYGEVTGWLPHPDGGRYALCVRLFYDGTYGAEVRRWSPGTKVYERGKEQAHVEATFASASLPEALAWR